MHISPHRHEPFVVNPGIYNLTHCFFIQVSEMDILILTKLEFSILLLTLDIVSTLLFGATVSKPSPKEPQRSGLQVVCPGSHFCPIVHVKLSPVAWFVLCCVCR